MALEGAHLASRRILVCVSASIAAYKSVYVIRKLCSLGAFVSVAITPSTTRFVGAATFSAIASEPVYDDLWDNRGSISHTTLGNSVDLVLVVPATASLLAKMAHGIADDIVTASLLCTSPLTPIVVAPAMHEEMYDHPATQNNCNILRERGVHFLGPIDGKLAGGDTGRGRLIDPEEIVEYVVDRLKNLPLVNRDHVVYNNIEISKGEIDKPVILITAGGTREAIDPVRVITNRSSGKMGHAFACAAHARGNHVVLITSSDLSSDEGVERIEVESAHEMHMAVMKHLDRVDVVIMTAAVADATPKNVSPIKLKRDTGIDTIELVPTVDIVRDIVENKKDSTYVVCFAAESNDIVAHATKKLESKGVDLLIANDISRNDSGFGSDTNKVWIFEKNQEPVEYQTQDKQILAYELIELIDSRRLS